MRRVLPLSFLVLLALASCTDAPPSSPSPATPGTLGAGTPNMLVSDAYSGGPIHGAIFTTTPNGGVVNENVHYSDKREVYLDGGPPGHAPITAAGLPDGLYVFQITDPPGKVLLSMDPAKCRIVRLEGGVIKQLVKPSDVNAGWSDTYGNGQGTACHIADAPDGVAGASGHHDTNIDVDHGADGAIVVQMMPFLDTPNPGGVYKAWMTPLQEYIAKGGNPLTQMQATTVRGKPVGYARDPGFAPPLSKVKTDNFKVRERPPFIRVDKLIDANGDGLMTGDASYSTPPGWPVKVTEPVDGGTVTNYYFTPTDPIAVPHNSTVTVCEEVLSGWAFSYAFVDGVAASTTTETVGGKTYRCVEVAVGSGNVTINVAFGNVQPDARISISPLDDTNGIGEPHVLTGKVEVNPGSGWANAPAGTQISFAIVSGPGALSPSSCLTIGTTGECTVTLNSSSAGTTVVRASTTVTVSGVQLTRQTGPGVGTTAGDDARKVWVAGSLYWEKHDAFAARLAGATFQACRIEDRFGAAISPEECVSVTDNSAPDVNATGGVFSLINLALGKWRVTETAAPAGYELDPAPQSIILTTSSPNGTVGPFVNRIPGQALTPGYWKNHETQLVARLPQYLGGYPVTSFSIATGIFNAMNCSSSSSLDAVGCLAGHLLAAKLNVANGASSCINPKIADGDTFLAALPYVGVSQTYNLTALQRSAAIAIKDALDAYNNNIGCNQ